MFQGLAADGYVLINSKRSFAELGLGDIAQRFRRERLITLPATEIAQRHLGRPLPNAVLLGGFAALSGLITLESVQHAIRDTFGGAVAQKNEAAAAEAYASVREAMTKAPHAEAI